MHKNLKGLGNYPRKNILTSLLWLSGITFPASALGFALSPWPQGLVVFGVGIIPVLATVYFYNHWTKTDADRLQTEDYRIKIEATARMGLGEGTEIVIDQKDMKLTPNDKLNILDKDQ